MTSYDEIGGRPAVRAAVKVLYDRVTADPLLATYFADVDLERLEAHQRAFLAAALGGPELFAGRDMATAHSHLHVTDEAFDAIIEHLALALLDVGASPEAVGAVRRQIELFRAQVVGAVAAR